MTDSHVVVGTPTNPVALFAAEGRTTTAAVTDIGSIAYYDVAADAFGTVNVIADAGTKVFINALSNILGTVNLTANGGQLSVLAPTLSVLGTTNVLIENGGTFTSSADFLNLLGSESITFAGHGNTLSMTRGETLLNLSSTVIHGFGATDTIIDQNVDFSKIATYTIAGAGNQTVTFLDHNNTVLGQMVFAPNTFASPSTKTSYAANSGPAHNVRSANGAEQLAVCFLSGTRIATEAGETAVEALSVGDLVATRLGGETVFQPVIWIGSHSVAVSKNADADAYPVRIHADAFAAGAPGRDLLVTAEHCIHVDGKLIPVRMLVNERSIVVDRSITRFAYFHVELAKHSILVAEGLETESYLDTGNRTNFSNVPVTALVPDLAIDENHDAWSTRAAAPLAVDRAIVEPIWRRLAARASMLGFEKDDVGIALTDKPDLHLLLDNGRELASAWNYGGRHMYHIPSGSRAIRLLSRAAIPAVTVGPFVDDRRMLGVAVRKLVLWSGLTETVVPVAGLGTDGWHRPEDDHRWTNGNAALDLPIAGEDTFLDVYVAATVPYHRDVMAA